MKDLWFGLWMSVWGQTHLQLRLQGATGQQALDHVGAVQAVHTVAAEHSSLLGHRLPLWGHHEVTAHTETMEYNYTVHERRHRAGAAAEPTCIHLVSQQQGPLRSADAPISWRCTPCGSRRLHSWGQRRRGQSAVLRSQRMSPLCLIAQRFIVPEGAEIDAVPKQR